MIVQNSDTKIPIELCFGTSGIMGAAATDKGRLEILEHAFDQGIRHFDTAPLYGLGHAEKLLGKFATKRREDVVIATKFGLPHARLPLYLIPFVPIARYLNRRSNLAKNLINRTRPKRGISEVSEVSLSPAVTQQAGYDIGSMNRELDQSLSKLKTDYIDYFLFHECTELQISMELIDALEFNVRAGKIKQYGIATGTETSIAIVNRYGNFNGAIQVPHTVEPDRAQALGANHERVVHSVFNNQLFNDLINLQRNNEHAFTQLLDQIGNFSNTGNAPQAICLALAAQMNPSRKLLFSSRHKSKITECADLIDIASNHETIDVDSLLNALMGVS